MSKIGAKIVFKNVLAQFIGRLHDEVIRIPKRTYIIAKRAGRKKIAKIDIAFIIKRD